MTIEKTFQGAWRVSAIIGGWRYSKQYFYYTKREAVELFKEEFLKGK
jgi:hypothetical protein